MTRSKKKLESRPVSFDPRFSLSQKMVKNIIGIADVRGFISALSLAEGPLDNLRKEARLRDALYSVRIEGNKLTSEEALQIMNGETPEKARPDDVAEFKNYLEAMDFIEENFQGRRDEIREVDLRDLHHMVTRNVRGGEEGGRYRLVQNYVGEAVDSFRGIPKKKRFEDKGRKFKILHTPPPAQDVPSLVNHLLGWINSTDVTTILIAGIAHQRLAHIHPFLDGNGRTARLLTTLILKNRGYDFKRLFTLSDFYDHRRSDYYAALATVKGRRPDYTEWLLYFTGAMARQALGVKMTAIHLHLEESAKAAGFGDDAVALLKGIMATKKPTTLEWCAKRMKMSEGKAGNLLEKMEKVGLVRKDPYQGTFRVRVG